MRGEGGGRCDASIMKPTTRLIITIDGPAGTGKSTVARSLAARLDVDFLDTGAMYRAAALLVDELDLDITDGPAVVAAVQRCGLRFDWSADPPRLLVELPDGLTDISQRIRDSAVTEAVSIVAGLPEVRDLMVARQREIAGARRRMVSEGRDQGSIVFPDAQVKFYLDATPQVRAARRARQLREAGLTAVDENRIYESISARDRLDATRKVGPLVAPEDAILIDSSRLDEEEVVAVLERHVRDCVALDDSDSDPKR